MKNENPRLKHNNFDLLRLVFASIVCLVHISALSGFKPLYWLENVFSSEFAVKAFFVVSGTLIFMSYERSRSLKSYFEKRIRRIYPAYFTIVVLSSLLLCMASTNEAHNYFNNSWFKYLIANLVFLNFLHPTLPGVFEHNKVTAVNGALWTLKIEVIFYLSVPVIVLLFRKFGKPVVMITIYLLSVFYMWTLVHFAAKTGSESYLILARQLPGQMAYFIAGAFIYYYMPLFEKHIKLFIATAVIIVATNHFYTLPFADPIAVAVIVGFLGLYGYVGNFGKYGDFSYGVYIIHFPIIQTLVWSGWFVSSPYLFLITVIVLTFCGAFLMWHWIENRFLNRTSHYIVATR